MAGGRRRYRSAYWWRAAPRQWSPRRRRGAPLREDLPPRPLSVLFIFNRGTVTILLGVSGDGSSAITTPPLFPPPFVKVQQDVGQRLLFCMEGSEAEAAPWRLRADPQWRAVGGATAAAWHTSVVPGAGAVRYLEKAIKRRLDGP